MTRHVLPPSVVVCTCWLPTYSLLWSCGLIVRGSVQTKRYFRLSAGQPIVDCGHTSTSFTTPVRRSMRDTMPPTLPEPDALDQTRFVSTVSGVAHPLSPPPTLRQSPR